MDRPRRYGKAPFRVAVIHGGPGAAGGMAPVARELSKTLGVLEPRQTRGSIAGQVQELRAILEQHGDLPIHLLGWSWGAWLSYLLAVYHPSLVGSLILVGSGPFEEKYAARIMKTRSDRLTEKERAEFQSLSRSFDDPATQKKEKLLARLGELFEKTDSYEPIAARSEIIDVRWDIYQRVWHEAVQLRRSRRLLQLGKRIRCRVTAIHGAYDPHPYQGVQEPLSRTIKDFRFFLLRKCGHCPWMERNARERFFGILREQLARSESRRLALRAADL